MKKFLTIAASLMIAALSFSSCEKDDFSKAPALPSVETLKIKMPQTVATKASEPVDETDPAYTYNKCIENALAQWNKIYETIINTPLKGFEMASQITPVQDGKQWTWSLLVGEGLATYEVDIVGTVARKHVDWEIHVSSNLWSGKTNNYAWITGTSALDGSEGSWNIMAGPSYNVVLVTVDWTAKNHDVQSVKSTYRLDKLFGGILAAFNGSYIEYSSGASDSAYTDTLTVHYYQEGLGFIDVFIEWNDLDGQCRIKSEAELGDKEWHC